MIKLRYRSLCKLFALRFTRPIGGMQHAKKTEIVKMMNRLINSDSESSPFQCAFLYPERDRDRERKLSNSLCNSFEGDCDVKKNTTTSIL